MSTYRYSGEIRIRVTYIEPIALDSYSDGTPRHPNGKFRCFLRGPGGAKTTIIVGAPACFDHAVDSPEEFDDAARAAMSFAEHEADEARKEGKDYHTWNGEWEEDGRSRHVGRAWAYRWANKKTNNVSTSSV